MSTIAENGLYPPIIDPYLPEILKGSDIELPFNAFASLSASAGFRILSPSKISVFMVFHLLSGKGAAIRRALVDQSSSFGSRIRFSKRYTFIYSTPSFTVKTSIPVAFTMWRMYRPSGSSVAGSAVLPSGLMAIEDALSSSAWSAI